MIYRVFQIHLDRSTAFPGTPEFEMYCDATVFPKAPAIKTAWDAGMYTLAGLVDADDEEEAFELTNLWEKPEKVAKIADKMHSMSVGDVIIDAVNKKVFCASFGFKEF